jgi:hypothetical protein
VESFFEICVIRERKGIFQSSRNWTLTKKGTDKISPFFLSSRKHHEKMNIVAILNSFSELVGVCGGMIDKNLNGVEQFILLGKQRLLDSGELGDEVVEALAYCIALHGHDILAIGELPVS